MKITRYIPLVAAAFCLTACSLDQDPYSEIGANSYLKDDASVNNLVMGAYSSLHDVMYYEWAVTEVRSDNTRSHDTKTSNDNQKLQTDLDKGVMDSQNAWVEKYWAAAYETVARCNNVLEKLSIVQDDVARRQYEGEVKFLRSMMYFNLVRLWGPVFLVTKTTGSDEARTMQRSSEDDVYALIEQDLENIIDNKLLPVSMANTDIGRADLIAAKALLAKVYVTHYKAGSAQYAKAAELCKEVLENRGVTNTPGAADLVPYDKIFSINNEMSKEIIFAVRYTGGNQGLGSPFGNLFAPVNNGASVILGAANNFNCPSTDLIDAYGMSDLRKDVNLAESYENTTTHKIIKASYVKKYTNPVTTAFDGESDWPVIRIGDIALLYAEILYDINGNADESLNYINKVRVRAGVPEVTADKVSTKKAFQKVLRNERRLELAFENQRWFDLVRWGIAVSTVNAQFNAEEFYTGYTSIPKLDANHVLLPIPVSVTNINPDVAQNSGY